MYGYQPYGDDKPEGREERPRHTRLCESCGNASSHCHCRGGLEFTTGQDGLDRHASSFSTIRQQTGGVRPVYDLGSQSRPRKCRRIGSPTTSAEDKYVRVPRIAKSFKIGGDEESKVYMGDSSTLAFSHYVQSIAASVLGTGHLSLEADLNVDLESIPSASVRPLTQQDPEILRVDEASSLARYYLDLTHGIFDLFSEHDVLAKLESGAYDLDEPSMLLILAIGAQQRQHAGDDTFAESCFSRGFHQVAVHTLSIPTLVNVQELLLVALYLLVVSRWEAAFVQIGAAARMAVSIGLNGDGQLGSGSPDRVKAWKCLRMLDVWTCASLGRPLATSTVEEQSFDPDSREIVVEDQNTSTVRSMDSRCLQLCSITEAVLSRVYKEKTLSLGFARHMLQRLHDWKKDLPDGQLTGKNPGATESSSSTTLLCHAHMVALFHWSIILLTRPFLMNDVSEKVKMKHSDRSPTLQPELPDEEVFIDTCIDSAMQYLETTHTLRQHKPLPKKPFLLVDATIVSAAVLTLAVFGNYDKSLPLISSLSNAEAFLKHLSPHDPHAKQHLARVKDLISSAEQYRSKRDSTDLQKRTADITRLFGGVSQGTGAWLGVLESSHHFQSDDLGGNGLRPVKRLRTSSSSSSRGSSTETDDQMEKSRRLKETHTTEIPPSIATEEPQHQHPPSLTTHQTLTDSRFDSPAVDEDEFDRWLLSGQGPGLV